MSVSRSLQSSWDATNETQRTNLGYAEPKLADALKKANDLLTTGLEAIRKNQHLPVVKVFNEIENYGNTSSNTIPISLVSLFEAGGERAAGPIGLTAFGGGFTFGAAVLFPQ